MSKFLLLFKRIDPESKELFTEKAFVTAKVLRFFAILSLIVTLIMIVPAIFIFIS